MKILHIQDAWEIPKFVKQLSEVPVIADACVITDVTELFQDDTHHFIISECPLSPEEKVQALLNYWKEEDDGEDI